MPEEDRSLLNNVEALIAELNGLSDYSRRAAEIVSVLRGLAQQNPHIAEYLRGRLENCSEFYTKTCLSIALIPLNNVIPQAAE